MGKSSVLGNKFWFCIENFMFLPVKCFFKGICCPYWEGGIVEEILRFYSEDCFSTEMRLYWIYRWPLCTTIRTVCDS